jgi:hypothetical protein
MLGVYISKSLIFRGGFARGLILSKAPKLIKRHLWFLKNLFLNLNFIFCKLLGRTPGASSVSSQAVEVLLWPSPSVCAYNDTIVAHVRDSDSEKSSSPHGQRSS